MIELDKDGFIVTDEEMRTSLSGVWAADDCRSKIGRQIVIACGEGATAAISIENYLDSLRV